MANIGGLPHYKHSIAANELYEPVFNPMFSVAFTPGANLSGIADWDLVLNNVLKVSGFDSGKNFPGVKDQSYMGAKRGYVGGKVPDQHQEIELSFEVNLGDNNDMYVFNALRAWCDKVYNPMTGKFGMKRNYVAENMIITQYNQDGGVFRQVILDHPYPITAIKGPDNWDWESDEIYRVEGWKLRVDDYDEAWKRSK